MMLLSETRQRARKQHLCDSCLQPISPGVEYWRQVQKDDGEIVTFREHTTCREASEIVASYMSGFDLEECGMPRIVDMGAEDRETVRTEDPAVVDAIWGQAVG